MRGVLLAGAGLVAALAWWSMSPAKDAGAGHAAPAEPAHRVQAASATPPASFFDWQTWAQPAPDAAPPAEAAPPALAQVPITLTAPARLGLGEQAELLVGLATHAAVGEVSFRLDVDPDVLQLRTASPGERVLADGLEARFDAEIPENADRALIRSVLPGGRVGTAGGTVALLQVHAVALGSTTVRLSELTVRDPGGRLMPVLLPASTLRLTVEAQPASMPAAAPASVHAFIDLPAATSAESGD